MNCSDLNILYSQINSQAIASLVSSVVSKMTWTWLIAKLIGLALIRTNCRLARCLGRRSEFHVMQGWTPGSGIYNELSELMPCISHTSISFVVFYDSFKFSILYHT